MLSLTGYNGEEMEDKSQKEHRDRLRKKFLKSGIGAFHHYEIVEMLLTLSRTRIDCKPIAKEAIQKFKTLRGVLSASPEELQSIQGIGPASVFVIKLIEQVSQQLLQENMTDKAYCKSSKEVFDYLYLSMRDLKIETFKVMFLNVQNQILVVENLFEGTLSASAVYPREVVGKAIKYNAAAMIFAHNHPSGNPAPSVDDKQITRDLVFASCVMQIKVLDHLIIGDNKYFSFADDGLLEKYEKDFSGIRKA